MKYEYPAELPVSAARDEIASAVKRSQVVIVSGQTGSGKTTQLPKILLELGRGTHGKQIVHTQPRRIAARTVAERIASEMGVKLGDEVGYQVRFTDESSPSTRLRVVTDGILLAQIQRDPKLTRYDTIIIDEAHERSLNIDFLLGYLTALLPQRRDLKLIITSATIDSVKFQEHFEHALHEKVPVIEVSGRTFPVQVVYEPLGTAPALMREVPGFAVGARPGDADYDELASAIAGEYGTPVAAIVSETQGDWCNTDLQVTEYAPDTAKQMLADAGYTEPVEFTLSIRTGSTFYEQIATLIKSEVDQAGFSCNIELLESATLTDKYSSQSHQATILQWVDDYQDPSGVVGWTVDYDQAQCFYTGLNDEELDALYMAAQTEMDHDKRVEMYRDIQQQVYDNANVIPLYRNDFAFARSAKVDGLQVNPFYVYQAMYWTKAN